MDNFEWLLVRRRVKLGKKSCTVVDQALILNVIVDLDQLKMKIVEVILQYHFSCRFIFYVHFW